MATLTTNISSVSLTVSGNTTQSTTISWTCPSVPAGSTINSCTLSGIATASMNKGDATIKVNGTTISSGNNFTINLGTGNTTTSVAATAVGSNKNARGTVTFSDLVYKVNYTESVVTYTVTFKDWDGSVLKTQTVNSGSSATAPSNPSREGYTFTGWDKTFTNVTANLTVTAQYTINKYMVTFVDYDGTILKTEEVEYGSSATAPSVSRDGYELIGWSIDFTNVISDITTIAQYKISPTLKIKENGMWTTNIGRVYKKIGGVWIEQMNDSWADLFNLNIRYKRQGMFGVLYSNGTLVFSNDISIDDIYEDVVETYINWDEVKFSTFAQTPWYKHRYAIRQVYVKNTITPLNTTRMFGDCSSLTSLDLSNFDTSNVTDMSWMFSYCSSLTSLDLSNFDTSNVTNMDSMFCWCANLASLDLSNFDTSNVTNMYNMFGNCSSLTSLDLSNFDTSNVTNMYNMFGDCSSLTSLDLSNFDTSNVTDMSWMFSDCSSLTSLDLSNFDTSNVTNMHRMFFNCTNLQTIYVKDQTAKTKIESSTFFPNQATVIIGSPNN